MKRNIFTIIYFFAGICFLNSCTDRTTNTSKDSSRQAQAQPVDIDSLVVKDLKIPENNSKPDIIYGDTIYVYPYGTQVWLDTITNENWGVNLSVWVDTTDFIIDTVKTTKGSRLVIGYNHYYNLEFQKNNKYWFSMGFNKREDLANILSETDSWIASNLNVFHNLIYNKRYNSFIIEFNISSSNQFSSLYYIVFNTNGKLDYIGSANSWGGGGPDGEPFLTENGELYVTCFEVYNFNSGAAINLNEYATMAEYRSNEHHSIEYKQIHALRDLGNNYFLTIFNQEYNFQQLNGLIMGTDTNLIKRFCYYGFIEDLDAVLLVTEDTEMNNTFLFDSERETLIIIKRNDSIEIRESKLPDMVKVGTDSGFTSTDYALIDFGIYCTYQFYYTDSDSIVYYKSDQVD